MNRLRLFLFASWIATCLFTGRASAASVAELQDLVDDARSTIEDFATDAEMQWFREHVRDAQGVLIVPRLWKGGFIFGGSGGSGVLLARDPQLGSWSYPAFYTIGSVTVGAQIGGTVSEVVLLIMTQRGMDSLLATSVKLGAEVEAAAGPIGVGTRAATADILSFSRGKGLFGGATVDGAVVASRDGWNETYYEKARLRPMDVLFQHGAQNPRAEALRESVAKVAGQELPPVAQP